MQEPNYQELLSMVHQLDDYLRAIRSEELDGSEPALESLLDQSQALWTRAGAGRTPDTNAAATTAMASRPWADIVAVTLPDGEKHLFMEIQAVGSGSVMSRSVQGVEISGQIAHYEVRAPGKVVVQLPPVSEEELHQLSLAILRCEVQAEIRPCDFLGDWASPVRFNAVPYLISHELNDLKRLFDEWPQRWDSQAARSLFWFDQGKKVEAHQTCTIPFELGIDEEEVVALVCLLSGLHGALGEGDRISDITQSMWDDFCLAAHGIGAAKCPAEEEADTEPCDLPAPTT
ncbi:hypothetical protein KBW71_00795 [Hydrogenophaga aromaticivorans]|uniref:hypothetical protein n=1 Tax=Hydrogenophaga aromaticivorans TaxID=2610898 RepID=UPI001B367A6D|nr:hypothetical protein [Hydrogenophaga aromaticivorans]MBQ0916989.1 hypothetical protein [Hydrogenophaga aromaticivorans]